MKLVNIMKLYNIENSNKCNMNKNIKKNFMSKNAKKYLS